MKKVKCGITRYSKKGSYRFTGYGILDGNDLITKYKDVSGNQVEHRYEDVMNIKYDTGKAPLITLKNFINTNEQVKEIFKDILKNYENAEDFFTFGQNTIEFVENVDEIEFLKSSYKLLCEDCDDKTELRYKAHRVYWTTRNFNDAINKYLKTAYFPLIRFIQTKLEELILEFEDEENSPCQKIIRLKLNKKVEKEIKLKLANLRTKKPTLFFKKKVFGWVF